MDQIFLYCLSCDRTDVFIKICRSVQNQRLFAKLICKHPIKGRHWERLNAITTFELMRLVLTIERSTKIFLIKFELNLAVNF